MKLSARAAEYVRGQYPTRHRFAAFHAFQAGYRAAQRDAIEAVRAALQQPSKGRQAGAR